MKSYKDFEGYKWYGHTGSDSDVVVSTRVRFARNLRDYPFAPRLDATGAAEIIEKVKKVPELADFEYTDFSKLSGETAASFTERHIVSREFAGAKGVHGLLANPKLGAYIMLCEEDHIRLQVMKSGLSLKDCLAEALRLEDALDRSLPLAYSEKFGYLTHCPTNLGTGMRASVMLFLPLMSGTGEIGALQNQLSKLGLTIRGMSGEGSRGDGCLYQVSNQVTLGISEEETIKKLSAVVESIMKRERELRASLADDRKLRVRDSVRRALGTLKYAETMTTKEMLELYSRVRLGATLGMTDGITETRFDEMLFSSMPATIVAEAGGKVTTPMDRDIARAKKIREALT